jgi:uncharacterized GH25 family protein
MNHIYPFLLLFRILTGFDEGPGFLVSLISDAEKYNLSYPSEHVFIETDRSYYKPGDELWFKAYVRNTLSNKDLSNDLNIKLVDVFGNQVLYLRYPIFNNESNGYFVLPALLEEGKYNMIGYTGWMKNMPVSEAFSKEIIVSNHINRNFDISVEFNRKLYYPGNQVEGNVFIHLPDGSSLKRAKYYFLCRSPKKNITSGWGIIDESGSSQFNFELPDNIVSDFLWIEFKVRYKRNLETYVLPFPIAKKTVHLEFYPEGGGLIAGLENRVAFKATDNNGMPVEIEGYLVDDSGKQLNKINSTYKGLGIFTFIPELRQYQIRLVKPLIPGSHFNFPVIEPEGILLNHAGFRDGNILFSLRSSDQNRSEKVYLVVEQRAKIGWAASVDFEHYKLVKVPAEKFQTGIVKCTVMDEAGKQIAARNVFLNEGFSDKELNFSASKNYYTTRERVILEFKNQSAAGLLANVAVFNDKYFQDSELLIQNYFHFVTELTEINSVLIKSELSNQDINLIMLTHEARSLPLEKLLRNEVKEYAPFYNNDGIRGQILDKKGNPVENARVKIIHSLDLRTYQATSDAQGIFHIIFNNNIINYDFLTIAVADENGRSGSILKIFDHYSHEIIEGKIVDKEHWKYNQDVDLIKYGNPLLLYSGRYGQGKFQGRKETFPKGYDYERFANYTSIFDVIKEIKDYKIVNREIIFSGRTSSLGNLRGAIIVVDGTAVGTDIEILNRISPKEVRNISISTWPSDIQRYTALNSVGVIEISTIHGQQDNNLSQIQEYQQDFLMIDHRFSMPDYPGGENPQSDNRITLFWKPDISIEKYGTGKVTFYTSDITGVFKCLLQGTDQQGNFFSKIIDITVR